MCNQIQNMEHAHNVCLPFDVPRTGCEEDVFLLGDQSLVSPAHKLRGQKPDFQHAHDSHLAEALGIQHNPAVEFQFLVLGGHNEAAC